MLQTLPFAKSLPLPVLVSKSTTALKQIFQANLRYRNLDVFGNLKQAIRIDNIFTALLFYKM